jgi:hypothetical protein
MKSNNSLLLNKKRPRPNKSVISVRKPNKHVKIIKDEEDEIGIFNEKELKDCVLEIRTEDNSSLYLDI